MPGAERSVLFQAMGRSKQKEGRPKIDKEDALVLLDMLEKLLGVHDMILPETKSPKG